MTLTLLPVPPQHAPVFFLSLQGALSQLLEQIFRPIPHSNIFMLISYLQNLIDILRVQVS